VKKRALRRPLDDKARAKPATLKKPRLTVKQRAAVMAALKNPDLTLQQIGEKAGYGEHSHSPEARAKAQKVGADTALRSPNTRAAFLEAFAANPGLSNSRLAKVLEEGLSAEVVKPFAHEGHVVDEKTYIDYPTRASYLALAARLGGIEPPKQMDVGGVKGSPIEIEVRDADIKDAVAKAGFTKEELIALLAEKEIPSVEAPAPLSPEPAPLPPPETPNEGS